MEAWQIWMGRVFQRGGAAPEKALSHQVRRLVFIVFSRLALVDLRQWVGAWRGRRSVRLVGARLFSAL